MATLLKIVVAGTCGVMLGLLFTILTLNSDARGVVAGAWRGSPREGTIDADPYLLAGIQRAGTLPLGAAEGLSFVAVDDSDGAPLSPACTYDVSGAFPPARFWTLSVLTPDGLPIANAAQRYALTSAEVLRQSDEPVRIVVSRDARSGNWLPVGGPGTYVLMLRLYDTGLSALGSTITARAMPVIAKVGCR